MSCFLLKTNIEGEFEWLQTLGIDGSLANPELLLHSNEISILGSLWGRVEFNGESIAEAFIGSVHAFCLFQSMDLLVRVIY